MATELPFIAITGSADGRRIYKVMGRTSEPADGARKYSTAQPRGTGTGPLQTPAYYLAAREVKKKNGPQRDNPTSSR